MTKVVRKNVTCFKCGKSSEQMIVYSVNYSLGSKEANDRLVNHLQKCPYCGYEARNISLKPPKKTLLQRLFGKK